jgi:RNA polymerase sigma factor (sigma-70 family)
LKGPFPMKQQDLIPHLFRTEYSKITAVLCKLLGLDHMELAEDIASESFLAAMESWTYKGIPENPTAWLYAVAKNKAKNQLTRKRLFAEKIQGQLRSSAQQSEQIEIDLSAANITDSQLQMIFAICHPSLPAEAQIGLALRILCGFGIEEIAKALLTNKDSINKRLQRAREKLRTEKVKIEFPSGSQLSIRLKPVLTCYYSETSDAIIREDLCLEAMRLSHLLIENEQTNLPEVNALLSLMCFQASRFEARKNENGNIILYDDQDEKLWNKELIASGAYYLHQASKGNRLSKYQIEAAIAFWHTNKTDTKEKWEAILDLFNQLLQIEYSPIAALNRTYAVSKTRGKVAAIREAEKLGLNDNPYYFTLLGTLYSDIDHLKSRQYFLQALGLAKTEADKEIIRKKISN